MPTVPHCQQLVGTPRPFPTLTVLGSCSQALVVYALIGSQWGTFADCSEWLLSQKSRAAQGALITAGMKCEGTKNTARILVNFLDNLCSGDSGLCERMSWQFLGESASCLGTPLTSLCGWKDAGGCITVKAMETSVH